MNSWLLYIIDYVHTRSKTLLQTKNTNTVQKEIKYNQSGKDKETVASWSHEERGAEKGDVRIHTRKLVWHFKEFH